MLSYQHRCRKTSPSNLNSNSNVFGSLSTPCPCQPQSVHADLHGTRVMVPLP